MGYLRQSFVRGIYDTAGAVPWHRRITRHIFCIEQVWLGAAGACHPLPAEVIAGQVTIEQVAIKPIGPCAPMDLAQMHHVTGQPHAGMVVHAAAVIKAANGHVNGVHTRLGLMNVIGDRPAVVMVGQWAAVQGSEYRVTPVLPNMPEVRTPSKLKDKFVLLLEVVALGHPFVNFTQADKPVGDVG